MPDEVMTIGQMCAEFGVTPRTLRFYESKELIFPIRQGQRRLFTRACRGRMKLIMQGKRFGFSLEDIRQLLNLYNVDDQQTTQLTRTCEKARERLAEMQAQRDELSGAIAELSAQLAQIQNILAQRSAEAAE
ncbi:MerR family transcriptional regulator [Abyssibius alkaniclasticus]|uniref:MerR family transcriptional regulator n=1 Tax=Abyssibius alkaniclasticus TaxID=2881234 RepID=UPI00405A4768|tara:strand:- start:882 stop:1277 length:396 start_codon:yes stop_codon:yes gene_type:complete